MESKKSSQELRHGESKRGGIFWSKMIFFFIFSPILLSSFFPFCLELELGVLALVCFFFQFFCKNWKTNTSILHLQRPFWTPFKLDFFPHFRKKDHQKKIGRESSTKYENGGKYHTWTCKSGMNKIFKNKRTTSRKLQKNDHTISQKEQIVRKPDIVTWKNERHVVISVDDESSVKIPLLQKNFLCKQSTP